MKIINNTPKIKIKIFETIGEIRHPRLFFIIFVSIKNTSAEVMKNINMYYYAVLRSNG